MDRQRPEVQFVTSTPEVNVTHGLSRALKQLEKEQQLFERFDSQRAISLQKCKGRTFENVQIGSGPHPIDGFTNLDLGFDADITWDIREGMPFDDESVGFIFSEHTLEHIDYPVSVKNHFDDLYRILSPGGIAVIGVPNGRLIAEAYVNNDLGLITEYQKKWYKNRDCLAYFNTPVDTLNYVFRDQDDSDTYTPHFWAYDAEKMFQLFSDTGFDQESIGLWEFDPAIATPKREWGTLYVQAGKPL